MTDILFIGDVHGKWNEYCHILETVECDRSIQVGDFGWGFPKENPTEVQYLEDTMRSGNHMYIRGNHDNPEKCLEHVMCINDGTYEEETGIFYMGGAKSVDQMMRTEGVSWWRDEELSYAAVDSIIESYLSIKPKIMVTHDAPETIVQAVFPFYRFDGGSRTRQALDAMFMWHKPEIWIFGHWHHSVDQDVLGTRAICLNELEYKNINV